MRLWLWLKKEGKRLNGGNIELNMEYFTYGRKEVKNRVPLSTMLVLFCIPSCFVHCALRWDTRYKNSDLNSESEMYLYVLCLSLVLGLTEWDWTLLTQERQRQTQLWQLTWRQTAKVHQLTQSQSCDWDTGYYVYVVRVSEGTFTLYPTPTTTLCMYVVCLCYTNSNANAMTYIYDVPIMFEMYMNDEYES
jgi:hypothetical protein